MSSPTIETRRTVLVADDELSIRKVLSATLKRDGYEVFVASDGAEALELLRTHPIDLVLTDLRMPKVDGMALLRHVLAEHAGVPVVILTAHGTVDTAVEAMKLGAFDFLSKPFDQDELRLVIKKASATAALSTAEPEPGSGSRYGLIGHSPKLERVFRMIDKVAAAPSTVLITGESGTGKELVAAAIHHHSPRKEKPFIRINCAAIPRDLIESELFGYERGAFTGAVASKPGRFELADGGTLFLDEIGEMPLPLQAKLLRALEQGEIRRVGQSTPFAVDVRVLSATHRDLSARVREGYFREDVYYRLKVLSLEVPPLRERREDIWPLARHFLAEETGPARAFSPAAAGRLLSYSWPGNVRELQNAVRHGAALAVGPTVEPEDLPLELSRATTSAARSTSPSALLPLAEVERSYIRQVVEACGGSQSEAARVLGIARNTLWRKLQRA
jgi:DNA-binding NtrC family response regulator